MGLFDIFKKKPKQASNPSQETTAKTPAFKVEYLDDITFIQDMKHTPLESCHRYDILLAAQCYGWNFMVEWADYMGSSDLPKITEVIVGEFGGGRSNITEQFFQNNSKLSGLVEIEEEQGFLSIKGISTILKREIVLVWYNQTRAMRIFTLIDDEQLIMQYAESVVRWNFGTEDTMKLGKPIPNEQ